jgi:hypothetical protein
MVVLCYNLFLYKKNNIYNDFALRLEIFFINNSNFAVIKSKLYLINSDEKVN